MRHSTRRRGRVLTERELRDLQRRHPRAKLANAYVDADGVVHCTLLHTRERLVGTLPQPISAMWERQAHFQKVVRVPEYVD